MDIDGIRTALTNEISPTQFPADGNILAAVLIIIYGHDPIILMTKKAKTLKQHGGEISFPGGKWQSSDHDLLETAIRETNEELSLSIDRNQILGQLDNVTTLNSKYTITPFISIIDKIPNLKPNSEVESVLHIPLFSFLETISNDTNPEHNSIKEMYTLTFEKHIVWGASARMLRQLNILLNRKKLL
jgi:8-oxo-dGTP pyrophosphatase MutT (NUDIX family)|tara:strand:- start:659 stop:1219 length:561 start_codon:yes stop_codon:yes gene_type:complete